MTWLLLLLLVFATYRVTRLLTRDELPLVKVPRDLLANWLDPRDEHGRLAEPAPLRGFGRAVAYGIECDWCTAAWVSAVLTLTAAATVGLPYPWLVWPACAGAAGLVATAEQRTGQRSRHTDLQITQLQAELRRRGGVA